MFYELLHYLESTGDDFGLIRDTDVQRIEANGDASGLCPLVVESSSLHCVVLRSGATLALVEVEYAPETWWNELSHAGIAFDHFEEHGEPVELPAGRYVLGDVNALCRDEPSPASSPTTPAASVVLEWTKPMVATGVELDFDAETRLVGYLLKPQERG